MSFFVKACVIGLKNYPSINAEIQGDEVVYKNYYNISIAVGTDRGLVVPLRKTDEMSFADIEKNIGGLGQKQEMGKSLLKIYKEAHLQLLTVEFMDQCFNSNFKSSSISSAWNAQYC